MKISTRLRLAVYVPAIMALVIIVALVFSYQEMGKTQENGDIIRQIRSSITELNHFVFSYILHHEERPKQQFLAEHEELTRLIASAHFQNPDQQRLLDSIRQNNETMGDLFLQLVSNHESVSTAGTGEVQGAEDRLVGLLLLRSYEADNSAALLSSLLDEAVRTTEIGTAGLIFLVMILATIPLTFVLVRTRRSITSSLSSLSKGAAVIGSGNLDFRIEEKRNDEIGDLSRAFNRMTADLKTVTASKTDLEREIGERKKAEEQLVAYERLATLGMVSASIAHELRNPLATVDSSALLLDRELQKVTQAVPEQTESRLKKHIDRIKSSVTRSTTVIQSLQDLTRMKPPEKEEHDLRSIADEVLGDIVPASTRIARDFPQDVVAVAADKEQLRMAFSNIIDNALQAMGGEGTLSVRIHCKDGQCEISFTDTGPGIPAESLPRVFEPLYTTKAKGMGLGLAIARMIIDRHRGTIEAKSEPGNGASLIVKMPMFKS